MEEKKYIFCSNCGEKLVATAKFCNACGSRIATATPPPVTHKVDSTPVTPPPALKSSPAPNSATPPPVPDPVSAPKKERSTVYDGEIHKCPNCGEVISSFVTNCPACGFELSRKQVSASLQRFIDRVDECDRKIASSPETKKGWASWSKSKRIWWVILNLLFMCVPLVIYLVWPLVRINATPKLTVEEKQLVSVIENFPFPNDRESILAALVYAKEKIGFISKEKIDRKSAYWMRLWTTKADQLKQKADMMFPNDPIVKESYNEILADNARVKKTIKIKGIIGLVVLAVAIIFTVVRYGVLDRVGVTGGKDTSATFEWQNYGLFTQIPEPETHNGKIVLESDNQIQIELYKISAKEFNDYVGACKNAGFTEGITKTDSVFYANDDEGYKLSIFYYENKDTMNVYVSAYDLGSNTDNSGSEDATDENNTTQEPHDPTENTTGSTQNSTPTSAIISGDDSVDVTIENNEYLVVKEFAWFKPGDYLECAIVIHNNSSDMAIEYPTFRVTAYDANNKVLGSEEQTLSVIYPQQDFVCYQLLFEPSSAPAKITVTLVEPDEYNITSASVLEHPQFIPMVGQNISVNTGDLFESVTGEIYNSNDYKFDSAMLTVIFRDADGEIYYAAQDFVDKIPANGSIPFDIDVNVDGKEPATCEVFGYPW